MPRGYLKRSSRAVGKKVARGGSGKSPSIPKSYYSRYYPPPKVGQIRSRLAQVDEDDLFDYNDFRDEDCLYEGDRNQNGSQEHSMVSRGLPSLADFTGNVSPNNKADGADTSIAGSLAFSEADSYSFCVDVDDESAFSLIDSVGGSGVATSSTKENHMTLQEANTDEAASIDEDMSYIAIDTEDDVESSFSLSFSEISAAMSLQLPVEATAKLVQDTAPSKAVMEDNTTLDMSSDCLRCAICLEEKPLMKLMKNCRHPSACYDCLRMMYVIKPQEAETFDSHNYPLKCYWPNCGRILRDTQIKKLVESQQELHDHYSCESYAKERREQEMEENYRKAQRDKAARRRLLTFSRIHSCPGCGCDNAVRPYSDLHNHTGGGDATNNNKDDYEDECYCRVRCKYCSQSFQVDKVPSKEILSVLVALGGWDFSICPSCGTLVVKDGGCDHMTCHCGTHFSYDKGSRMKQEEL